MEDSDSFPHKDVANDELASSGRLNTGSAWPIDPCVLEIAGLLG